MLIEISLISRFEIKLTVRKYLVLSVIIFTRVAFILIFNGHSVPLMKIEPLNEKTCLMPYANNKGADQPAHP